LGERLGKTHFWLMFIGFNLTFAPFHILGLQGMPRRIYTYPENMGWDFWNFAATIGAFIIALSFVVFMWNVVLSRKRGEEAGNDPWDGRTIEWMIPSPPPEYNFAEIPIIEHRDDFWHRKYLTTPEGTPSRVFAGGEAVADEHEEGHGIHMPDPSYFPLVAAFGVPIAAYGVLYQWWLIPAGLAITLLGFMGWVLEPAAEGDH
jgi:cytochrome c oxidase subunit 1